MKRLSEKTLWEDIYYTSKRPTRLSIDGFKNFSNRKILEKLMKIPMEGKEILEIGAGDSLWLPFLCKMYPSSHFTGLDYSEFGCHMLRQRAKEEGVKIEVVNADLFNPPIELLEKFDVVISFGVVEHFDDLVSVLTSVKTFTKPEGTMFTLIPNMRGVMGYLTRKFSKEIYEAHNPHDLSSFLKGHEEAGLKVIDAGYLCSNNFAMLSMSVQKASKITYEFYKFLTRVSKVVWAFESHFFELPATSTFSPYIYCISCRGGESG